MRIEGSWGIGIKKSHDFPPVDIFKYETVIFLFWDKKDKTFTKDRKLKEVNFIGNQSLGPPIIFLS